MYKAKIIAIAVVVVALIVVIGLIGISSREAQEAPATAQSEEAIGQANESEGASEDQAAEEAQEEAQGEMYEGALAGLTEEEIAALALAEEAAETDGIGGEDAVD